MTRTTPTLGHMCPPPPATPDLPPELGVRLTTEGAQFCVYAGHARSVEVCLFDPAADGTTTERRVPLRHRAHGTWFDTVPGVAAGQRYAFRVDGDWDPDRSLLHNPAKLLLDPYARAIEGGVHLDRALYAHRVGPDLRGDLSVRDDRDSAPHMPRCVIVEDGFDWGADEFPRHSLTESLIYEVHVKNATKLHPGVPEDLRGTYAGLAHPAFVDHLLGLGVTAVELLPVHTFTHEPDLVLRGLTNHWGYNTLGFFAPHAAYASTPDPQGALDEFKTMVKDLHAAGIEVLLDVVYNHTAENAREGMTLSWRGLDQRAYYRVDGSRFDLAVALGRGKDDGYDRDHPFLVALRTDPVLSRAKLVAEPWDLGIHGWRTGQFPPPFSEWNDRYRDATRTFWLRDLAASASGGVGHGVRELATRLAGSQDLFDRHDRGAIASVNFVTAHDGFTLADLTTYDTKHNGANGHSGADGSNDNRSWNHGVEGRTDDPDITAARRRSIRNLLGTLLLSTGVPMLNAGDEVGRSQRGNNNPYSQDNEISWMSWDLEPWQDDLLATTRHLVRLRHEHPVLRQRAFFSGRQVHADGSTDLAWFAADGLPMEERWDGPASTVLQALYEGARISQQSVLVVVNGAAQPAEVTLPKGPGATAYDLLWDSADDRPATPDGAADAGTAVAMQAASMHVWRSTAG